MTTENATLHVATETPAKKKAAKKKPAKKNNPFNASLFAKDILAKREKENLSYSAIEKATGLNIAIIHRAARKEGISIDSLVSLANWLNKPVYHYF